MWCDLWDGATWKYHKGGKHAFQSYLLKAGKYLYFLKLKINNVGEKNYENIGLYNFIGVVEMLNLVIAQ